MFKPVISSVFMLTIVNFTICSEHLGPDPWDYKKVDTLSIEIDNVDVPPDLRIPVKKKTQPTGNMANGEWFFKRVLAIMLNGGQTKFYDDGSVDISLKLRLEPERWQTLNEYTKSNIILTEDMFRRSIAYVEEAICKPSVSEKISMAWSEYVQKFIIDNKTYIVWSFGILAGSGLVFWLWTHMSHKHVIILIILALYLYEVIISYKEAEKQELEKFLQAVNKCNWYFWKSSCEISPPDPIIFMKHMNPMKIGLRMFTTILSEPMIALNAAVNTMVHDFTDKMWFPFNIIIHGIFIMFINIMLIVLLVMIIFNYILNIPFNLNIFGFGSIQVKQRRRNVNFDTSNNNSQPIEGDKISGATLDKILDVFSRALDSKNTPKSALNDIASYVPKLTRSSSTGRLPNSSLESSALSISKGNAKKRASPPLSTKTRRKPWHKAFMFGGGDNKSRGEGEKNKKNE